MDFHLTREQELVRQMMHDFTENEVKPIAAETDKTSTYPAAQQRRCPLQRQNQRPARSVRKRLPCGLRSACGGTSPSVREYRLQ